MILPSLPVFSSQEGVLLDLLLRAAFSPAHPLARRDVPLARTRAFKFSPLRPKGSSRTVLHCAHRTSTVSLCAFCEQEGWSGCSTPTLLGRALREHRRSTGHPPTPASSPPHPREQFHQQGLRARGKVRLAPKVHDLLIHLGLRRIGMDRAGDRLRSGAGFHRN